MYLSKPPLKEKKVILLTFCILFNLHIIYSSTMLVNLSKKKIVPVKDYRFTSICSLNNLNSYPRLLEATSTFLLHYSPQCSCVMFAQDERSNLHSRRGLERLYMQGLSRVIHRPVRP